MHRYINIYARVIPALLLLVLFSCSTEKFVGDNELMLKKVKVTCDNSTIKVSELEQYNCQRTNTKWLSTFKVPLGIYALAGLDSTKWINRALKRMGEKPVLLDTALMRNTQRDISLAMYDKGYLSAKVSPVVSRTGKSAVLHFFVESGEPYIVRSINYDIHDSIIARILPDELFRIRKGQVFTIHSLNDERKAITSFLHNRGYYMFNKDFITYDVDSSEVNRSVYIRMHLNKYRRNNQSALTNHPCYTIRSINYTVPSEGRVKLRRSVVRNNTAIEVGEQYSAERLQRTYNNFSRMPAVRYTSIHFDEDPDSMLLDCNIQLSRAKVNTLQFAPEGTNTAGDLGAAASLTYSNKNMFHGSETFSITGRAAYEAITGLDGYSNQNYKEYGIESSFKFPRILFPFVSDKKIHALNSSSELTFSYNLQDRPEFHRRMFNVVWNYKWENRAQHAQYKIDFLDVNYLWMPWISQTFKHDYIDSVSNRNVILRYNYEDLLIMKIGFGYTRNYRGNTLRFNIETAGNLLNALSRPLRFTRNADGNYEFISIAYAQYAKGDFDYSHNIIVDDRNSLVLHGRFGIAYPYGNSKVLPFEKRYFAGGPNSLRGWSVRSLGPGKYRGTDGRIDFINQTGDIRLEVNAELRTKLFWMFQGALFVDAGNIWTIKEYDEQPGGAFHFDTFWQQLAANYGLGIRLNLSYFVIRFDMGMKAVNPAYDDPRYHYPIIHPVLSRDFAFHFAVGMAF